MPDTLPPDLHAKVIAELRAQVIGAVCPCGAMKGPTAPFCDACVVLLGKSGCTRRNELEIIGYYAQHPKHFAVRAWKTYDELVDVSLALRTGRWDGSRSKRSEEA